MIGIALHARLAAKSKPKPDTAVRYHINGTRGQRPNKPQANGCIDLASAPKLPRGEVKNGRWKENIATHCKKNRKLVTIRLHRSVLKQAAVFTRYAILRSSWVDHLLKIPVFNLQYAKNVKGMPFPIYGIFCLTTFSCIHDWVLSIASAWLKQVPWQLHVRRLRY